jgi:hypothetical protein
MLCGNARHSPFFASELSQLQSLHSQELHSHQHHPKQLTTKKKNPQITELNIASAHTLDTGHK